MSVIMHRCKCGHLEMWHRQGGSCDGVGCHCLALASTTVPEVVRTWRADINATGRQLVAALVKPGAVSRAFGHITFTTCGCPACKALYTQLGGVVA